MNMKNFNKFLIFGFSLFLVQAFTACSDDDDQLSNPNENSTTITLGFENVDSKYFGGPTSYGANLYEGASDQITTGYLAPLDFGKYAQFSINYGYNYNAQFNMAWCYTLYNGGLALSYFHDMEDASYNNQLSVYDSTSPSKGNFIVATGSSSIIDPSLAKYSDYEGCGKVYITDATGYTVKNPGQDTQVSGNDEDAYFKSVYLNNTTYTYKVIENGDGFTSESLEKQKGWFKVQFIAFDDDDPNEKPLGYVEAYLANFDESLNIGYMGIIDEWIKVDLSSLPECSILVINFVGSDSGEWGLNTPSYCALDDFEITVEE